MADWGTPLLAFAVASTVLLTGSDAWAQFTRQPDEGIIILSARELAQARKKGIQAPAGTWHAWAWQRRGSAVQWTLRGEELGTKTAEKTGAFAWVKLGTVDAQDGKPISVEFNPASAKPKDAAVAALALVRSAQRDPSELWQMARVFPHSPRAVEDKRPQQCRHLNQRFTMPEYDTQAGWEARAAWLRNHIRASTGLLPEPERTPLKPRVFDKIERDGYTIEKAFFESRPGFTCCGNLYRPLGKKGPFPAVACPHGHWGAGRFGHEPPRGSVPARCITLARLGYVVFAWDMVGYNDSAKQVGSHRGVFASKQNELWGLSLMHLQSWNTIRALDFLQSLPDVDGKRLGLTGCSGGGTQTFMVMGIDERVTAAAPVNMISGIMQGGCECENAPLLRIETNNIEIGALMAPRPLLMCSVTGDWTRETPTVEYPSIRSVYQLYDAAGRVKNVHDDAKHGYNLRHRKAVYAFFRRWVKGIEDDKEIEEPPYEPEKKEDLLIFNGRKLPEDAKSPKQLEQYIAEKCRRQRDALLPKNAEDRQRFLDTLGTAYRHSIPAELPKSSQVAAETLGTATVGKVKLTRLLLGRKGKEDQVPAVTYRPKAAAGQGATTLVVHPRGKAALIDPATGRPGKLLDALLASGRRVLAIDAYLTGEFHSPFAVTEQKQDKKYFTTYNRTALVQRVQDILTALAYLKRQRSVTSLSLVGLEGAGAWCLLAAPFTPEDTAIAADLQQLAGDTDPRWTKDLFTPCILKAGAPWTPAALAGPRPLFLHNLADDFATKPLRNGYRSANAAGRLRLESRRCGATALVNWLPKP
jgi:hypothetical protein